MQGDICPICNEGFLSDHFSENDGLKYEYSVCSYCGAESTDVYQTERNKERKLQWERSTKFYGNY